MPSPCNTLGLKLAALSLALGSSVGCTQGTTPFALISVCLEDHQDVSEFLAELREEAARSGMTFSDGSARMAKVIALDQRAPREFVLRVSAVHPHGYGLSAGELKSGYQVAIGFNGDTDSRDTAEARSWADTVIARINKKWRVEVVADPSESGAFPISDCPAR